MYFALVEDETVVAFSIVKVSRGKRVAILDCTPATPMPRVWAKEVAEIALRRLQDTKGPLDARVTEAAKVLEYWWTWWENQPARDKRCQVWYGWRERG